jgi:hypothetical protein
MPVQGVTKLSHKCEVRHLPSGRYLVKCVTICGTVGVQQDYEGDAQAIADRHEEIGGFER